MAGIALGDAKLARRLPVGWQGTVAQMRSKRQIEHFGDL